MLGVHCGENDSFDKYVDKNRDIYKIFEGNLDGLCSIKHLHSIFIHQGYDSLKS